MKATSSTLKQHFITYKRCLTKKRSYVAEWVLISARLLRPILLVVYIGPGLACHPLVNKSSASQLSLTKRKRHASKKKHLKPYKPACR